MLANKIKKFMCRAGSIYEGGKLKVPGHIVAFWVLFGLILIWVVGLLFYSLVTEPIKTFEILALMAGATGILFLIVKIIELIIPQFIKTYLILMGSKLELTCDNVVFPEEVKSIYTQIEALNEENTSYFLKGIHPLLRKLGDEI